MALSPRERVDMTVKELIGYLKELPQNKEVWIQNSESVYCCIERIDNNLYGIDNDDEEPPVVITIEDC